MGTEGLPRLLQESDFVIIAAPLTPETQGFNRRARAAAHEVHRSHYQRWARGLSFRNLCSFELSRKAGLREQAWM